MSVDIFHVIFMPELNYVTVILSTMYHNINNNAVISNCRYLPFFYFTKIWVYKDKDYLLLLYNWSNLSGKLFDGIF